MNNDTPYQATPKAMTRSLWTHRHLLKSLIKREVIGRYKGSALGIFWSFFNPILMLTVYTFVFSVVFKARWSGGTDSKTEFALVLFAGLLIFNIFSECINRAPGIVLNNSNYVKKVIFPLETLPVVALGSAITHLLIGFLVWVIFHAIFFGTPNAKILLLPIAILPFLMLTLGLSWILASLGVYLRDISQVIGVATTILMFLSPIFYPTAALPESVQPLIKVSPLTYAVEQARDLMIWNKGIQWSTWICHFLASALVLQIGFAWFQKTRKGFADVI